MAWYLRHGLRFACSKRHPRSVPCGGRGGLAAAGHSARYEGSPGLATRQPGKHYPTKDEIADYLHGYAAGPTADPLRDGYGCVVARLPTRCERGRPPGARVVGQRASTVNGTVSTSPSVVQNWPHTW
jgi:hypothetical protein